LAAYLEFYRSGELSGRRDVAVALLGSCCVCPRNCGVNRLAGDTGRRRTSRRAIVSSYGPHLGEEVPLVGKRDSGTIFFANRALRCLFWQNYSISQLAQYHPCYNALEIPGLGRRVSSAEFAEALSLAHEAGLTRLNKARPVQILRYDEGGA